MKKHISPFETHQPVHPFVMVIFGATGDLTETKLIPAIYNLLKQGIMPEQFYIVGYSRRDYSHDDYREFVRKNLEKQFNKDSFDQKIWQKLAKNIYYQKGYFEQDEPYKELVKLLSGFDKKQGACITRFFYLATPPQYYSMILSKLDETELSKGCGQGSSKWTRILIEKPFGKNLITAKKLEDQLCSIFDEKQIYRIDHYLAKETVQNILVFRFANCPIDSIWNSGCIDNVQITLFEKEGVVGRESFYESVGALRDVAQNHLMAMLAYTTMEQPKSMKAEDIRKERVRVLSKMRLYDEKDVLQNVARGQYGEGEVNGKKVKSYRQEREVDNHSNVETFVAFKLFIDNKRWKGIPFYLRTGKRMAESLVQIDLQFYRPYFIDALDHKEKTMKHTDAISIRIQPKEGISMRFFAKKPGLFMNLQPVDMEFSYKKSFEHKVGDAYEKLLLDCMRGDQTLFATGPGFQKTWEFVSRIRSAWKKEKSPKFPNYQAGSWGPKEAEELIRKDGKSWILK